MTGFFCISFYAYYWLAVVQFLPEHSLMVTRQLNVLNMEISYVGAIVLRQKNNKPQAKQLSSDDNVILNSVNNSRIHLINQKQIQIIFLRVRHGLIVASWVFIVEVLVVQGTLLMRKQAQDGKKNVPA